MATFRSEAAISGLCPDGRKAGETFTRYEMYTAEAARAAASVVEVVPVPKNCRIIEILLDWSAFGAGRTLDVGDASNADRFFDGLDVSAAGNAQLNEDGVVGSLGYEYTAQDTIDVTVIGNTMPEDGWLKMAVTYIMTDVIADDN